MAQGAHNKGRIFGRPFKKGVSGNPRGAAKLSAEACKALRLGREDFLILANKYRTMTRQQLLDVAKDPDTQAFDLAVIAWIKEMTQGDWKAVDKFLDRLIGKVKENIDLHTDGPDIRHEHIFAVINEIDKKDK